MSKDTSLSVRELFQGVCEKIKKEFRGEQITLLNRAMSEIADDSDYHRSRTGYMRYNSVVLVKIGEKNWALGLGVAGGGYPADPYNSDIIALLISPNGKSNEELAQEIYKAIETTSHFHDSIICGMADGRLFLKKNAHFGKKMMGVLQSGIKDYIAQNLEIDLTVFHMDLRPVVKSSMKYKSEFVDFLKDSITGLLKEA